MDYYIEIKAFHVIAVITWIIGVVSLSRLFVYHSTARKKETTQTFKLMEKQLYHTLMTPAMLASLILGLWMIYLMPAHLMEPWLHAKLGLVVVMIVLHHMLGHWRKKFHQEKNRHSAKFFRRVNVFLLFLIIGIILLVMVHPDLHFLSDRSQ